MMTMIRDMWGEVRWALVGNKARSGLTILGIVIGIASVITMISIGYGSQQTVSEQIEQIGSNLIMIMPGSQNVGGVQQGAGSAQTLTTDDVQAIAAEIAHLVAVAPVVSGSYQVTAGSANTRTQITGTTPDYMTARNVTVAEGTFFSEVHNAQKAKVAVLGPSTRDDLFGTDADVVGKTIRVNNVIFTVIGVTVSKGGSGFNNQDDIVYVPMTTAQSYLVGSTTAVHSISVTVDDQSAMTTAQEDIEQLLLARHDIADPNDADFRIMNQSDILATATSVTGTFTLLLSSIAGISLLVGGIGIMNMMLTTVTERTREIGLRKAVGIRRIYILRQFLAEAVVLTMVGGVVGVALGVGVSLVLTHVFAVTTVLTASSILLSCGVSAAVGVVFGYYPARRAAALSPIEALRYE